MNGFPVNELCSAAAQQQLSERTILAYSRVWTKLAAWCASARKQPGALSFDDAREFYGRVGEGKSGSTQIQIRAAIAYAFRYLDLVNPFAKLPSPVLRDAQINYLLGADFGKVTAALETARTDYYGHLAYALALSLFFTASRFTSIAHLRWPDLVWSAGKLWAFRLRVKGGEFQDVPAAKELSDVLGDWRLYQEQLKGMRAMRARGLAFCRSEFVFASLSGRPISNEGFNRRLKDACESAKVSALTAHGIRHSAASILLNQAGNNLAEVQQVLRHKNIKTTVRYTHIMTEQTRHNLERLGGFLK